MIGRLPRGRGKQPQLAGRLLQPAHPDTIGVKKVPAMSGGKLGDLPWVRAARRRRRDLMKRVEHILMSDAAPRYHVLSGLLVRPH